MIRKTATLLLALFLAASLAGCAKEGQEKEMLLEALQKQSEVKNYRFSGTMTIRGNPSLSSGAGETSRQKDLVAGFLADGTMEWNGVASVEPVRLEMELRLTSNREKQTYSIPILLKDNKMYFSLPMENLKDRFFAMDLNKWANPTRQASGSNRLESLPHLSPQVWKQWMSGMDAGWFRMETNASQPSDKVVFIEFDKQNAGKFAEEALKQLPAVIDLLRQKEIIAQPPEGYMENISENLRTSMEKIRDIQGKIAFHIDQNGFIRQQEIHLDYVKETDSAESKTQFALILRQDDLNQNPPFQREIPKETIPIEKFFQ